MDLLCSAYGVASDEESEGEAALSARKRSRPEGYSQPQQRRRPSPAAAAVHHCRPSRGLAEASVSASTAGRYISKRERAIMAAVSEATTPPPPSTAVVTSPVVGSISDSNLSSEVLASLRCKAKGLTRSNINSGQLFVALSGHSKAVNCIQWSHSHGHLLASAGMDQTVHVWNVWSRDQQKARVFKYHNAAVKNVRWSPQGLSLLSCGYDCASRLVDVEMGTETQVFKENQIVEVIEFHPGDCNLFLSGGSKGFLRLWDLRVGKVVKEYLRGLGPILDIELSADGKHFISSSDTSKSNISENSIIVWDVTRQIPLSNQVYTEAYTCPCVRYHPSDACFVAQSNGNYIAIFSAKPPFKLDKYKRYEKHGVWGFPIKCNFGLNGNELASGSSDGCIYFYSYKSSELLGKIEAFQQACIDVAFHPLVPNVIASCSWTGEVSVFE